MGAVRKSLKTLYSNTVRNVKSSHLASGIEGNNSYNIRSEDIKPFTDIPGPKGLPYIGTLFQYTKGPHSVKKFHLALIERYRQYGPIVKETIAGNTVVRLFDPEYIKVMYGHDGKAPIIPPLLETTQIYRKQKNMSPGLGNTNGEEWYRLRTNINQMMMRPKSVTMFLPQVNEVADDFILHIKATRNQGTGEMDNFSNDISKWILESSAMTCFEKRLGCFQAGPESFQQNMIDSVDNMFSLSLKLKFGIPWYKLSHILSPTWKKLIQSEDFFFSNAQMIVDETIDYINNLMNKGELDGDKYGFLTYLLGKKDLTYKELSVITMSLFADGLTTTAPTMAGQLYCIANNPAKQEKLYKEITKLTPQGIDKPITTEVINAASYLKACIKEGFRFFPVGTEVSRIPQKDIVIGGYHIPAGTHVELNNNMLLRLPEYFENAESYIPERWTRGGSAQNIHPYLLLPFGHGPRTCAGRRFAEQEMIVMIIKLLQNFHLEWNGEKKMEQTYNMLLKPDIPCRIKLTPRT